MGWTVDISRYTNVVYIGIYSVLTYNKRLILTVCDFFSFFCWCYIRYFWHVKKLMQYSYLRAFSIGICGKFNSSYPVFLSYFMRSLNCASLICKIYILFWTFSVMWTVLAMHDISQCRIEKLNSTVSHFSYFSYFTF